MNGSGQASRSFFTVLTFVVVIAALRLAEDVLIPLALAMLLTFLLAPISLRLQRWGVNRLLAVIVTVVVGFAVLGGLLYVVFEQLLELVHELPQYRDQLIHNVSTLAGALRGGMGRIASLIAELSSDLKKVEPARVHALPQVEVVEPPLSSLQALKQVFVPLAGPIATAAVVIVFVIFMLLRFSDLRDRIIRVLGPRNLRMATEAIDDAARRVSRYLVMQTLINSWEGLCVAVGLTFIGVPNAILWGALTTVLRFIPYVGIWVAASMPLVVCFAVFDRWTPLLYTVLLFVGAELVNYIVLEPWLYSRRTGVSPLALLVAAVFWAWLWGAAGLFLAIPLTVCLVVMGKYIPQLAFLHVLLGDQPALGQHERLYQRLLTSNSEDAADLLDEELRRQPLLGVCDSVILPAMRLIERDHDQGALREVKRQAMLEQIEHWIEEIADSAAARGGAAVARAAAVSASGRPTTVLCLPAADRADEIAARLAAVVLSERGLDARDILRARLQGLEDEEAPTVILISVLPRDGAAHARQLCRRTRAHFPQTPIVVGLWHAEADLQRLQRLTRVGATRVMTTLDGAVAEVEALAGAAEPPTTPTAPEPPTFAVHRVHA